ncbi:MAG: four helix bundle protein [Phycisphaerales bacterium JB054]
MSESIRSYRDLVAWQRARELVRTTYQASGSFPQEERFGLASQIRRAAISVMANIAEGYGRGTRQDYLRFLRMSRGSLFEVESHALAAIDLGFMTEKAADGILETVTDVGKPLSGLIRSLEE